MKHPGLMLMLLLAALPMMMASGPAIASPESKNLQNDLTTERTLLVLPLKGQKQVRGRRSNLTIGDFYFLTATAKVDVPPELLLNFKPGLPFERDVQIPYGP